MARSLKSILRERGSRRRGTSCLFQYCSPKPDEGMRRAEFLSSLRIPIFHGFDRPVQNESLRTLLQLPPSDSGIEAIPSLEALDGLVLNIHIAIVLWRPKSECAFVHRPFGVDDERDMVELRRHPHTTAVWARSAFGLLRRVERQPLRTGWRVSACGFWVYAMHPRAEPVRVCQPQIWIL